MADTRTYSVQAAGVYTGTEQLPLPGVHVKVAHVIIPALALPGRVLADLRCARALGGCWIGASTLAVMGENAPTVTIRLAPEMLQAWRDGDPQLVKVHVGVAAELLIDAPPLPPGA